MAEILETRYLEYDILIKCDCGHEMEIDSNNSDSKNTCEICGRLHFVGVKSGDPKIV